MKTNNSSGEDAAECILNFVRRDCNNTLLFRERPLSVECQPGMDLIV